VIVNDFDIDGAVLGPDEADAPLLIDANAVLPFSIALQGLETIAWRHLQVIKNQGPIQLRNLPKRRALDVRPTLDSLAVEQGFGVFALERLR
jgi:hypothetical protein